MPLVLVGGASHFTPLTPVEPPFVPPPVEETLVAFDVAAKPEGGWCWFQDVRAVYVASMGEVVFAYNNRDGDITVRTVNDTTRVASAVRRLALAETDDHDNPALLRRQSDSKFIAMWTTHVGSVFQSIAASADDIASLPVSSNITTEFGGLGGNAGFTYAHLFQLTGEAGTPKPIYFTVRYHNFGGLPFVGMARSVDDGVNWTDIDGTANAQSLLAEITYHKAVLNGTDRIDFIASNHPEDTDPVYGVQGIYHFYYQGGSLYQTDGTLIGVVGDGPQGGGSYARSALTEVDDGSGGTPWLWDIAVDSSHNPVLVYVVYEDPYPTGRWHYEYARWTGSAWEHFEIADAGTKFAATSNPAHGSQYAGGVVLDQEDPTICYFSSNHGTTFHEIYRAVVAGDDSVAVTAITSDSLEMQIRPIPVYDAANIKVLWNNGTYTDYLGNFNLGTRGAYVA